MKGQLRLFIAFPLPLELADEIGLLQRSLLRRVGSSEGGTESGTDTGSRLRSIGRDNLHLTSHFLGQLDPSRIAVLASLLTAATAIAAPVGLPVSVGAFPSLSRARGVTLDLEDPDGTLGLIHRELGTLLTGAGFTVERRGYRPHITLARVRGRTPLKLEAVPAVPERMRRRVRFEELVLFRSELGSAGARYYSEGRYPFTTKTEQ